jgi:hypothetical protein
VDRIAVAKRLVHGEGIAPGLSASGLEDDGARRGHGSLLEVVGPLYDKVDFLFNSPDLGRLVSSSAPSLDVVSTVRGAQRGLALRV